MKQSGNLYFFCGKMGAGKSTKSKEIAVNKNAVLLSEDEWLSSLYPNQIESFEDYLKFSAQIKPLVKKHVQNILSVGTDVVMDFSANTQGQRKWFLELALDVNASHQLIYLNLTNEQCLRQIAQGRIEQPDRAEFDTEEMFTHVTNFFEAPEVSEGLNILEFSGKE
ncbi:ATP-binding protein [Virgibacillus halodenitrificans]|uniref:ATP-binding protein n=1 Tax=Virgibacillus halodenitrificans TaxID=1482 RepID=A0ABR7VJ95_VIRHA|nr:ATP-binding protein [Virgibacillus halodenitrificans]MBD1221994.1 ATP-binding protein [Virgibacillus halodenitrificans]MCJ0930480.1 ATP-binding protein [Virgibacillus halodenitrificans]